MPRDQKAGFWRENVEQSLVDTDQNGLHLIFGASGLVHEHLLGDVLPPLHAVQLVMGVADQHRPAQELCQGLVQTTRVRKNERKKHIKTRKQLSRPPPPTRITMMYF